MSPDPHAPRLPVIAVLGVSASGKTTLVKGLKALGYPAFCVVQEHSLAPRLWRRRPADLTVVLDASYATVQRRRPGTLGPRLLEAERRRLADAIAHCDLWLPTDGLSPDEVLARVLALARRWTQDHRRRAPEGDLPDGRAG